MTYRIVPTLALLTMLAACAGNPSGQSGISDSKLPPNDPQVYNFYEAMGLLYPLQRAVAYTMFDAAEANPAQKPLYYCMIGKATSERIIAQIAPSVRSVFTDAEMERAIMFFYSPAGQKYRPGQTDLAANLTAAEYKVTLAFKRDFDAKFEALYQPELSRKMNAAIKPIWDVAFDECAAENPQSLVKVPLTSVQPEHVCEKVEVPFGDVLIDLNKEGIGLIIARQESGEFLIKRVVPGGPVHRTHAVSVDDEIVALSPNADGVFLDAESFSLPDLIRQLRGCPGAPVALRMKRGDEFYDIEVRRERVTAQ